MKSILFLLVAVFFWALNFYLGKIMMEYVTPNVAAFWRYFFGVVPLFIFAYSTLPRWSIIKEHLVGILLVGFVGLFAFIFLFFQALNLTSAVNGALIIGLNPAITVLFAVLFQGHKIDTKQVLGILLAFVGVSYLLTKGELSTIWGMDLNKGDALFVLTTSLFALQNIWVKKYAASLGNLNFTVLTSACCLLGFLIVMPFEVAFPVFSLPLRFWMAAIGMGVFGTALAYYCWNYGLSQIGAARAAIFVNAIPLFSALFAVFFGTALFSYHLISAVFIIGGLLVMQLSK